MDRPTIMLAFIVIGLPTIDVDVGLQPLLQVPREEARGRSHERRGESGAICVRSHELEQRVRVLEQIVTDGGAQTAAQIEALRGSPSRRSSSMPAEKSPTA